MHPNTRDYITGLYQILIGRRTQDEISLANERRRDIGSYLDFTKSIKVLDLANGRLRPQYLLLKASGYRVFGIDLINRPNSAGWIDRCFQIARWLYSWYIDTNGSPNNLERLVCGNVSKLPFVDGFFDLITSIASLEHFLNIPAVVPELARVMRPGGIVYVRIHPFTCLSGGHNVKLMEIPLRTIPKGIDAWDHLRKRRLPVTVLLNEWRISQYLDTFSEHFEILKNYCAMREGEHLLDSEIEAELEEYSRDELTCGAYVIVARKHF